MDSIDIINYARRMCGGVSTSQISDTLMLDILNKSYKDLYKKIVNLDKNYFWDRWTTDIVKDQYEYSMTMPSWTTYWIFKPEWLRIKYSTTGEFIDVEFRDWDNLTEIPEHYAEFQSTYEPFAIITDNKYLHIFPTPTVAITGWLIIEGAKQPYDLTISSTESEILIDPLYHETIAYMMCPWIYKEKQLPDRKNDAINEAEMEVQKTLKSMWIVKTKVLRWKRPDLSCFE